MTKVLGEKFNPSNKGAFRLSMLQVPGEIEKLVGWIEKEQIDITNVLEIGTNGGGLLFLLGCLQEKRLSESKFRHSEESAGSLFSIDLKEGPFSSRVDYEYRDDVLNKTFPANKPGSPLLPRLKMWEGKSLELVDKFKEDTKSEVRGDGPFIDFLIIDGDHQKSEEDYLAYAPLVKKGGWIMFHDIHDTEHHKNVKCTVPAVWKKLTPEGVTKIEFIEEKEAFGGIGLLKV